MSETLEEKEENSQGLNMGERQCTWCIHNQVCGALRELVKIQKGFDDEWAGEPIGFTEFPVNPMDLAKRCTKFTVSTTQLANDGV